jgi:hypothetical protein
MKRMKRHSLHFKFIKLLWDDIFLYRISFIKPDNFKENDSLLFVDATFGGGGYSRALLGNDKHFQDI